MSVPNPEVSGESTNLKVSPLLVFAGLAVVGGIVFSLLFQEPRAVEPASESEAEVSIEAAPELLVEDYSGGRSAPSTIDRVDRTLGQGERRQWAEDPSSHGFSDQDRAFLNEYGVSESEARAMETVLRESGVE